MLDRETAGELLSVMMDTLEDPLFLIDERRVVLVHNEAAARIARHVRTVRVRNQRLVLQARNDDLALERLIGAGTQPSALTNTCRALRTTRTGAGKAWLLVIAPLASSGRGGRRFFLVQLVRRLLPRSLPGSVLDDLYNLTRQEVALVEGLARHRTLRQIAERMSVSHETVRAYLKRVFRKCEVGSQLELLVLLQKLALFSG